MECGSCKSDPEFHSFRFLARIPNGDAVYYTCPASGKQRSMKEENIPDYIAHMDSASSSSWIWVFDCSGLQSYQIPSYTVIHKFVSLIQERYKFVLKSVVFVNMNWKMEMILSVARNFMKDETKKRLLVFNSRMELLSHGIPAEIIHKFNR